MKINLDKITKGYCPYCDKEVSINLVKETKQRTILDTKLTVTEYRCYCKDCGEICYNKKIEEYNDFLAEQEYRKYKGAAR